MNSTPIHARMNAEEELRLAREWREHASTEARERLVTANLGLVIAIANRYRHAGLPLEELIAEGNLGLLSAVDGYDPAFGSRFSTYAAYWIRNGISRAFAANSPRGRLNGKDRHDLNDMERTINQHHLRTGEAPTASELGKELGWSVERVHACRSLSASARRPRSLDRPLARSTGRAMEPASVPAPSSRREPDSSLVTAVEQMLDQLSPLERSVIELRFGLRGSRVQGVHAIAAALGRTRSEVRSALRMAMAKLSRNKTLRRLSDRPDTGTPAANES